LANVIEYLALELKIGNPLAVATLQEMKGLLG